MRGASITCGERCVKHTGRAPAGGNCSFVIGVSASLGSRQSFQSTSCARVSCDCRSRLPVAACSGAAWPPPSPWAACRRTGARSRRETAQAPNATAIVRQRRMVRLACLDRVPGAKGGRRRHDRLARYQSAERSQAIAWLICSAWPRASVPPFFNQFEW